MSDHPGTPATKKELLERMLERGMAMIHLDARRDDVDVPAQYRTDPQLRLNLSYRFQGGDLHVDGEHVRATLSFSGIPYTCMVPLDAIFAMVSHITGESFFFPTDAPPEALAVLAAIVGPMEGEPGEEKRPTGVPGSATSSASQRLAGGRPMLRAIDGGAGQEEEGAAEEPLAAAPAPAPAGEPEGDAEASAQAPEDRETEDRETEELADSTSATRRRGHLRLVK
jgi:stringent starvation protein B